jgi:hypothetical protein
MTSWLRTKCSAVELTGQVVLTGTVQISDGLRFPMLVRRRTWAPVRSVSPVGVEPTPRGVKARCSTL